MSTNLNPEEIGTIGGFIKETILPSLSDEQLLRELINRNKLISTGRQTTYYSKHKSATIGIGKDHTAEIVIDLESLKELMK
jgi:hypothetical protein